MKTLTITEELLADVAICLGGAWSLEIRDPWHNSRFVVCMETRSLESLDGELLVENPFPI